jgi:hypothetical protein
MRWQVRRPVVLVPVLLPVLLPIILAILLLFGEQWRRPEQWWGFQPQHKATLVAIWVVSVLHA